MERREGPDLLLLGVPGPPDGECLCWPDPVLWTLHLSGFLIMMVIGSFTAMAIVILTFGKFIWADGYNSLNAVLKKPKKFLPWLATLFLHSILVFVALFQLDVVKKNNSKPICIISTVLLVPQLLTFLGIARSSWLARNEPASNISELASAPTILTNGPGVTSGVHECQVSAESSSHNFMHENAPTLSHDPEAPPTYSEAVAAP